MAGIRLGVELLFGQEVPPERTEEIASIFLAAGVAVRARHSLAHRGGAELTWIVLAALPLQAFLTELGSQVLDDLYKAIKERFARRGKDSRAAEPVPLVVQDMASGLRIIVEADLPAAAYEQLATLDLSTFHNGPLHYDWHRSAWRSVLDEVGE